MPANPIPPTWGSLKHLLSSQLGLLGNIEPPKLGVQGDEYELKEKLKELDTECADKLDAAVRYFANTSHWPQLSRTEVFFLFQRIVYGGSLLDCLTIAHTASGTIPFPTPPAALSEAELLEWLLIDVWKAIGFDSWTNAGISIGLIGRQEPPGQAFSD